MVRVSVKIAVLLLFFNLQNKPLWSQTKDSIVLIDKRERRVEYATGVADMYKFIAANLRYSKKEPTCSEGNIYVYFCVETDGSLTNIKVQRGLCPAYDAEVVRVMSIMPKWLPALEYGTKKPVKSYFTLPIRIHFER